SPPGRTHHPPAPDGTPAPAWQTLPAAAVKSTSPDSATKCQCAMRVLSATLAAGPAVGNRSLGSLRTVIPGVGARLQAAAFAVENPELCQPDLLQAELQRRQQYAQAILHAAPEINRRSLRKILRRAGNLANVEAEENALRQHLIVKDKIVRVLQQRKILEHGAAERPVSGVIFRQLRAQTSVFEKRQKSVGNVFPQRHTTLPRLPSQNARAQHHVIDAKSDHARHGGYEQRRVLIIGMDHEDHVGAGGQSFAIAGLLIAAIAVVAVVHE